MRTYLPGDIVFVRATLLRPEPDLCQVRINDRWWTLTITQWVPRSEIAHREDIDGLKPQRPPPKPS